MSKKFTDLPSKATAATSDIVAIWDNAAAVNKQTPVSGLASAVASSLPAASVKASNIDFTTLSSRKSVDANGWTIYDLGGWKEYRKRCTFNQVIGGPTVVTIPTTLPVGVATIGANFLEYSYVTNTGAYGLKIVYEGTASSTSLNFTASGASATYAGWIDVTIVTQ